MNRPERSNAPRTTPLGLRDLPPPVIVDRSGRRLLEPAVVGLFVLAVLVSLRAASALAVPMIAAVMFGSVIAHAGDRAQRIGIPPVAAAMALVGATGIGLFLLGDALAEAFAGLTERLPEITGRIEAVVAGVLGPLGAFEKRLLGGSIVDGAGGDVGLGRFAPAIDLSSLSTLLGGLTPAFGEVLIFLATLAFFVAGRAALRRRTIMSFRDRDHRLAAIRVFNAGEAALATYFGTTSIIYVVVGLGTALIARAAGLSDPMLWGVCAFLLSFVPFLGPAIVAFALLSAGLVAHDGVVAALWPAGAFLLLHLVMENAVIPSILGRRFEINPFVVFVAIVFWTWMWGPMGAVLAVPLLLTARTVHDAVAGGNESGLPE